MNQERLKLLQGAGFIVASDEDEPGPSQSPHAGEGGSGHSGYLDFLRVCEVRNTAQRAQRSASRPCEQASRPPEAPAAGGYGAAPPHLLGQWRATLPRFAERPAVAEPPPPAAPSWPKSIITGYFGRIGGGPRKKFTLENSVSSQLRKGGDLWNYSCISMDRMCLSRRPSKSPPLKPSGLPSKGML